MKYAFQTGCGQYVSFPGGNEPTETVADPSEATQYTTVTEAIDAVQTRVLHARMWRSGMRLIRLEERTTLHAVPVE